FGEVGDVEVEKTVAVHVTKGDAHVRLGPSHRVDGHAAPDGLLLERAILLIDPQVIGGAVVGDEEIGPAIAVEVRAPDSEAWPRLTAQPGRLRHVLEADPAFGVPESAAVAEKAGDPAPEGFRGTVIGLVLAAATAPEGVVIDVVDDDEV